MSAADDLSAVVPVPFAELDRHVGERLLVAHRLGACSRTDGMQLPRGHRVERCKHLGGLSDVADGPEPVVARTLYLGGEWVLVTADDVVVTAPTPTELDVEPDIAASPYDT